MFSRSFASLTLALALVGLAACGGGGGSSSSNAPRADFLIHDAPSDQLSSFSATLTELHLLSNAGATANLLDGNVSLEFLGLQTSSAWLSRAHPPTGSYHAVAITLDPASIVARDKTGAPVAVTVQGNVLVAEFASTLQVLDGTYSHVVIDLDLANSLSGSVASPPLVFDPVGSSSSDDGANGEAIDEIKGVVTSFDANADSFVMSGVADDDAGSLIGSIRVQISNATMIFSKDDAVQTSAQFFASLEAGASIVEVHGTLVSGVIQAERVEIDDHGGSAGGEPVKIQGIVTSVDLLGSSFDLLITEVKKGESIVGPVLGTLGDPTTITVSFDQLTTFLIDSHTKGDSSALSVGSRLTAKFPSFVNSPFYSSEVELDEGPEFEGTITDVSGLPNSIVIHLEADEPAITSGQVASSNTDVVVTLGGASISLGVNAKPALVASQLLQQLKVQAHGAISGPASAPTIAATKLVVHPGRFDGEVSSISIQNASFLATVDDLKDSFGLNVANPPFTVLLDPNCAISGDGATAAQLFALFQNLGGNQILSVKVQGIGTGVPDELTAHAIDVRVK